MGCWCDSPFPYPVSKDPPLLSIRPGPSGDRYHTARQQPTGPLVHCHPPRARLPWVRTRDPGATHRRVERGVASSRPCRFVRVPCNSPGASRLVGYFEQPWVTGGQGTGSLLSLAACPLHRRAGPKVRSSLQRLNTVRTMYRRHTDGRKRAPRMATMSSGS